MRSLFPWPCGSPKWPCVIPGGRGSVRAGWRRGSPGGSPSQDRAKPFSAARPQPRRPQPDVTRRRSRVSRGDAEDAEKPSSLRIRVRLSRLGLPFRRCARRGDPTEEDAWIRLVNCRDLRRSVWQLNDHFHLAASNPPSWTSRVQAGHGSGSRVTRPSAWRIAAPHRLHEWPDGRRPPADENRRDRGVRTARRPLLHFQGDRMFELRRCPSSVRLMVNRSARIVSMRTADRLGINSWLPL